MQKKILVADDDPAIVDSMKTILEMEGYEVDTTEDGGDVYKLSGNFPDLMLLDIRMSGYDGREICRYLKQKPKTRNIPIIMISANLDMQQSARDSGADDFIAKPFNLDDLLSKVKKYAFQPVM